MLSFIIVNHRSEAYLKACLDSINKAARQIEYEIIIVHNEETAFGEQVFFAALPHVKIHYSEQNLGFAKANNQGTLLAQGDIFCFLNPDTVLLTENLSPILQDMQKKAIWGPQLVTDHKFTLQEWSTGKKITLWETIKNNLGLGKSHLLWQNKEQKKVDWLSGACLFVQKNVFQELGGFDENFFMYFEDVDLCLRAQNKGYKILHNPALQILHWGGKSKENAQSQKKFYYASQDYYFRKHFGPMRAWLLKILRFLFQKKA